VTKNFFTFLIFPVFFTAVTFIGCSSPIGGLLASDVADYIKVEPNRFMYLSEEDDPFIPAEDMAVFSIIKGKKTQISVEDVEIEVTDKGWGDSIEGDSIIISEEEKKEGRQLDEGIKDIVIRYKSMETFYRIYVGRKADGNTSGPSVIIDLGDWLRK